MTDIHLNDKNRGVYKMKKIFAILLTMVIIATMFIGCSKENSEPVNGTTEPISVETVEDVVEKMTEDVSVESTSTDDNGNEIVVGKDDNGNTVEIKTDSNGKVTKTVTDKETGKKTEQTTTVTTTKPADKPVTTTKAQSNTEAKKTGTTTKKSETTTKKATQTTKPQTQTTTKPATTTTTTKPANTTTTHTHKWVSKSKQVLVKEAWDETVYETVEKQEQHAFCNSCGIDEYEAWKADPQGCSNPLIWHMKHCNETNCTSNSRAAIVTITEQVPKTVHHDAQYKTETWYECSCGAKK